MYFGTIIIISLLSLFKIGDKISKLISKNRKIISNIIYFICFLCLFFILNEDTIKKTGDISIGLLWIILWLPILSKVFKLTIATKIMPFRKEIGILMGVLVFIHSLQYFIAPHYFHFWNLNFWWNDGILTPRFYGTLGTTIAIILTITSNKWSMKKMGGKKWKLLHRTTYLLMIFSLLHVYLLKVGSVIGIYSLLIEFIPFIIYIFLKIFEWKGKKLNIKKILNKK